MDASDVQSRLYDASEYERRAVKDCTNENIAIVSAILALASATAAVAAARQVQNEMNAPLVAKTMEHLDAAMAALKKLDD